ncbi:MAG: TIGR04053 family radical SAM/SPASM domain-containing protein [Euryarchaeota archaeon]|nr:TIGR04053 family radical SAM/SPASM domain-containing protein [Euryarchaeota archaeon]
MDRGPHGWDFRVRPLLVFWEATRACPLACRHCRASALTDPLPGELATGEAERFLESVADFGRPSPILVVTGGDPLARADLLPLLERARDLGLRLALAPAVSDALSESVLSRLAELGVSAMSISLDGEGPAHDRIRGVPGHWGKTCAAIRTAIDAGLRVQVNTCAMRDNGHQLPAIFARVRGLDAAGWEVFFLIRQGRGTGVEELTPEECEACAHFLYDAACRGLTVRTVEGPFFRRVVRQREAGAPPPDNALYRTLTATLQDCAGPPGECLAHTAGTRDGNGIAFVAYDGTIHPGGFLPIPCGNVRTASLRDVYVDHPLFRDLRAPERFRGRCGACEFRDLCGGSRARAFHRFGNPLGEDPACAYVPPAWTSRGEAEA